VGVNYCSYGHNLAWGYLHQQGLQISNNGSADVSNLLLHIYPNLRTCLTLNPHHAATTSLWLLLSRFLIPPSALPHLLRACQPTDPAERSSMVGGSSRAGGDVVPRAVGQLRPHARAREAVADHRLAVRAEGRCRR
jgi:hypothetical protein